MLLASGKVFTKRVTSFSFPINHTVAVWKVDWRVTDGENIKPIAIVQKMNDDNLNSLGGCRNSA